MKITIGVYAHVDAGKTTFSEALLYEAQTITSLGRVDKQSTLLDYHAIERTKGITVFSDTSHFSYLDQDYQLLDTPGHIDLMPEMEQTLPVVDIAILVINGNDGVQSHTLTLYRMLKKRGIPTYIFINKLDSQTSDLQACLQGIANYLTPDSYYVTNLSDLHSAAYWEWLANYDEPMLEAVLSEAVTPALTLAATQRVLANGDAVLIMGGSALKQVGITDFMTLITQTKPPLQAPLTPDFGAYVYKIIYNDKHERITLLKITSGQLVPRTSIVIGDESEKINELRRYSGAQYQQINHADVGDIIGVTGLKSTQIGMGLGNFTPDFTVAKKPMLRATMTSPQPFDTNFYQVIQHIKEQMPLIELHFPKDTSMIYIDFVGKIQLEVFQDLLAQTTTYQVDFSEYTVLYQETITDTVIGYGHYEPLGHYADVTLKLSPSDQPGISFNSDVTLEKLYKQAQNIIEDSLYARPQLGVLTGSPLTKIHVTLLDGKLSLLHTSKGDERAATWRAIRQGLEQAQSQVLEPWYAFEIIVPTDYMGRVLADIPKLHGQFNPPVINGDICTISGEGPVRDFAQYPEALAALSKGKGSIQFDFYDYLPCYDEAQVIAAIGYDKDRDLDYPSSSIHFKKGAGYEVKWQEVLARRQA